MRFAVLFNSAFIRNALVIGTVVSGIAAMTPHDLSAQAWTVWTEGSAGSFRGTLFGSDVFFLGGNKGGQLYDGTDVAGTLTPTTNPPYNYFDPSDPYTQSGLSVPGLGMIQFDAAAPVNTITFATPVLNPYLAIISLGTPNAQVVYSFDAPFTVVSSNNCPAPAFWGCGSYLVNGSVLFGSEFSGTIQFAGVFSSLSFATGLENWSGLTVGADGVVPEPATMMLLATGLAGMAAARRKVT